MLLFFVGICMQYAGWKLGQALCLDGRPRIPGQVPPIAYSAHPLHCPAVVICGVLNWGGGFAMLTGAVFMFLTMLD